MKHTTYRNRPQMHPRVHLLHAHRNGHSVLRGDASWRTVSGIGWYWRRNHHLVMWRRYRLKIDKHPSNDT